MGIILGLIIFIELDCFIQALSPFYKKNVSCTFQCYSPTPPDFHVLMGHLKTFLQGWVTIIYDLNLI